MIKIDEAIERQLVSADLVTVRELARAHGIAVETGEHLDVVLCRLGMVEEKEVARVVARALDLPIVDTRDYPPRPVLEDIITAEFMCNAQILPLAEDADAVTVAMADPRDRETIRSLELRLGKTVRPCVALPSELNRQIARHYGLGDEDDQPPWRSGVSTIDHIDIERLNPAFAKRGETFVQTTAPRSDQTLNLDSRAEAIILARRYLIGFDQRKCSYPIDDDNQYSDYRQCKRSR